MITFCGFCGSNNIWVYHGISASTITHYYVCQDCGHGKEFEDVDQ
jgi:hypothetical protein